MKRRFVDIYKKIVPKEKWEDFKPIEECIHVELFENQQDTEVEQNEPADSTPPPGPPDPKSYLPKTTENQPLKVEPNITEELQKVKDELDRKTTNIDRKMASYAGGGSVAVQYAKGGIMNGPLTINASLSAQEALFENVNAGSSLFNEINSISASFSTLSSDTGFFDTTITNTSIVSSISAAEYLNLPPTEVILNDQFTTTSIDLEGTDTYFVACSCVDSSIIVLLPSTPGNYKQRVIKRLDERLSYLVTLSAWEPVQIEFSDHFDLTKKGESVTAFFQNNNWYII